MKASLKIISWEKDLTHNLPSHEGITLPGNLKRSRDGSHSAPSAKLKGWSIISAADLFYRRFLLSRHMEFVTSRMLGTELIDKCGSSLSLHHH